MCRSCPFYVCEWLFRTLSLAWPFLCARILFNVSIAASVQSRSDLPNLKACCPFSTKILDAFSLCDVTRRDHFLKKERVQNVLGKFLAFVLF